MARTHTALAALRRPRLLVSAARFGLAQYDREAVLSRIFGASIPAPGEPCLRRLLEHEAEVDDARRSSLGTYAIADHVDALAAIMAESRLLHEPRESTDDVPAAAGCDVIPFGPRARAVS